MAEKGAAWTPRTRQTRGASIHAFVVMTHALTAVALLGSAVMAAAQPTAQPSAPPAQPGQSAPPTVAAIPIPEVAQHAEQMATLLRSSDGTAGADAGIEGVEVQLGEARDWISRRLVSTTDALASSPSASALANLTDSWQVMRSRLAGLDDVLTTRATVVQQRVGLLETIRTTWAATRANALGFTASSTVLARIDETMTAITAARRSADDRLAYLLGLQDRIVKEMARCDDVLARIAQTRNALEGPLLARDALPIWSFEARTRMSTDLGWRLRETVWDIADLIRDFVASQLTRVPFQVALLVVVAVLARLARRGARRRADKEPSEVAAAQVFELPLSSALVVTLIATVWIYPHPPRAVTSAVALLVLIPAVLIVRRLASRAVVPAVYALAAFFVVDRVRDVCSAVPVLEQWVFLLEMVSGIVFLALVVRSEQLLRGTGDATALEWRHVIAWLLWGQLFVLVVAVVVGAAGYMRLARLLGAEVITSNYVALVLYAGVRVAEGLLAYALRARPLRNLFIVQGHRAFVQRRLTWGLRWLAVATWAYFTLDGLGVMGSLWSAGKAVLDARYVRGSVRLSLGDVAAFALTVWAAFVVSSFVRFVLREDVYPRLQLPRGSAYAASTVLHYLLVLTGFVLAVAALGIDLNRITILAGALGVGVGIGLQNVVANFVSGLILLLERRLQVGDSIQLGSLAGQIREIGSRASTIRTWDGAEVIVPNAILTSERVTNWTLSDRLRRVDLDVGVAYAADPQRVLEILRTVATAHPKTLPDPAPMALCTGFGDSALKFELRAWTGLDDAESLLSDLAIAVHGALADAKIEIPFPQRDVHIRNGDRGG
jgi:small-conductance mechanosensitive channel